MTAAIFERVALHWKGTTERFVMANFLPARGRRRSPRREAGMAKRSKFRNGERRRFRALAVGTMQAVSGARGGHEAKGEALYAGIRSAVKATVPGLQSDEQVDAYTDLAVEAFLRTMRRRAKSPNPRGL